MGSRESVKGGNRDKVQRVSHFYKQRILLIPKLRGAFIMLRAAPSPSEPAGPLEPVNQLFSTPSSCSTTEAMSSMILSS